MPTQYRILLVKTSAIGDVIQTFPVLEYLRKKFPEAKIDWVVEKGIAPLLQAHPQVDRVISIDTKVWRKHPFARDTRRAFASFIRELRSTTYNVLFDFQGNTKSAVVTACAKADVKVGFNWKNIREKTNLLVTGRKFDVPSDLNIRLKYLRLVQQYFEDSSEFIPQGIRLKLNDVEQQRLTTVCQDQRLQNHPRLMVCFGSKWANKRLELSTLGEFLQKVAADSPSSFVFIFADPEENLTAEKMAQRFSERAMALGELSLALWQNLMWEMDGVIAVDSAGLHLCGTTATPSFSVFGPSLASCYKPLGNQHAFIQGSCPYKLSFSSRCPVLRTCRTGACMRQIQADDLFDSYLKWSAFH